MGTLCDAVQNAGCLEATVAVLAGRNPAELAVAEALLQLKPPAMEAPLAPGNFLWQGPTGAAGHGPMTTITFGKAKSYGVEPAFGKSEHSTGDGQYSGGALLRKDQQRQLQVQMLIYKYIVSNAPVPPELLALLPGAKHHPSHGAERSNHRLQRMPSASEGGAPHRSSAMSAGPAWDLASHQQQQRRSHRATSGFSAELLASDTSATRCRRTDGKRWRCSREVMPDQKYCILHIHRGKHRDRRGDQSMSHAPSLEDSLVSPTASVMSIGMKTMSEPVHRPQIESPAARISSHNENMAAQLHSLDRTFNRLDSKTMPNNTGDVISHYHRVSPAGLWGAVEPQEGGPFINFDLGFEEPFSRVPDFLNEDPVKCSEGDSQDARPWGTSKPKLPSSGRPLVPFPTSTAQARPLRHSFDESARLANLALQPDPLLDASPPYLSGDCVQEYITSLQTAAQEAKHQVATTRGRPPRHSIELGMLPMARATTPQWPPVTDWRPFPEPSTSQAVSMSVDTRSTGKGPGANRGVWGHDWEVTSSPLAEVLIGPHTAALAQRPETLGANGMLHQTRHAEAPAAGAASAGDDGEFNSGYRPLPPTSNGGHRGLEAFTNDDELGIWADVFGMPEGMEPIPLQSEQYRQRYDASNLGLSHILEGVAPRKKRRSSDAGRSIDNPILGGDDEATSVGRFAQYRPTPNWNSGDCRSPTGG
eukprot:jgi/Chlat1/445/Chrsp103S00943